MGCTACMAQEAQSGFDIGTLPCGQTVDEEDMVQIVRTQLLGMTSSASLAARKKDREKSDGKWSRICCTAILVLTVLPIAALVMTLEFRRLNGGIVQGIEF